jgi:uncharacterized membrane-anchored protein
MKAWLRSMLACQLLFFAGWAGLEEWRHYHSASLLLETEGYDPRDLISGHYLQLHYPISHVEKLQGFPTPSPERPLELWVRMEPAGSVRSGMRSYNSYRAVEVRLSAPGEGAAPWAKAHWSPGVGAIYGIERYYFSEARVGEMEGLRSGHVWVEADLSTDGQLRIVGLVKP